MRRTSERLRPGVPRRSRTGRVFVYLVPEREEHRCSARGLCDTTPFTRVCGVAAPQAETEDNR